MIRFIKSSNNWQDIKNVCRSVNNKDFSDKEITSDFKKELLLSEHSPIRMLTITWMWQDIKYWVSVHFTRHKVGIEHFVSTQREDRTGIDRNNKNQDALVNHSCIANAQAIMNISRKRLCYKAHSETRKEWVSFLNALQEIEPELYNLCVPECIYRNGFCPEMKSCGYNKTEDFKKIFEQYLIYIGT